MSLPKQHTFAYEDDITLVANDIGSRESSVSDRYCLYLVNQKSGKLKSRKMQDHVVIFI